MIQPAGIRLDLNVTPARLAHEAQAAGAIERWLRVRAYGLAWSSLGKGLSDPDLFKAWKPWNVFEPGDHYETLATDNQAVLDAGEETFYQIALKARQLGAKEAASALLKDPPRKFQEYTKRKLRILARQQVRLVDETTHRMVGRIAAYGKPQDAEALLQKVYSFSRCQTIAMDQVSKGYIRGVAEVLRNSGYRYIYARTMLDEKVCPRCAPWDSQPFTITRFIELYPRHPRCFVAGTQILMADGTTRPIEAIREGDMVITHQDRPRRVMATLAETVHEQGQMIVTEAGRTLEMTYEHPVLTPIGWVPASELQVGDSARSAEGWDPIVSVQAIPLDHVEVYNFAVEEDESYVANGLIASNCRCYPSTTREDGTRDAELHRKSILVDWEQAIYRKSWIRRPPA